MSVAAMRPCLIELYRHDPFRPDDVRPKYAPAPIAEGTNPPLS